MKRTAKTEAQIEPALLTEAETARYLSLSRDTLRQQRCLGPRPGALPVVPYVRFGTAIRYRLVDLDAYIAKHLVDVEQRTSGKAISEQYELGAAERLSPTAASSEPKDTVNENEDR